MSSSNTNSAVDGLKDGLKGIRGVGDAIRGTFNQSVDHAFNEPEGEAKNKAIADKGVQDINNANRVMDGSRTQNDGLRTGGVAASGTPSTVGDTTGAGTHSGTVGNLGSQGVATGAGDSTTATQETTTTSARY